MNRPILLWLTRAQRAAARHRRGITAGIVVVLAGTGITAFGIAPLAPDAAELPQRWVQEEVQPQDLRGQVDALAQHEMSLWRSEVSRGAESAESLLRRLGVTDLAAATFLSSDAQARKMLQGRTKMLQARLAQDGSLLELVARWAADDSELVKTHFTRLTLTRNGQRFALRSELVPLTAQVRLASGTIRTTLFAASDEARLPDAVAAQLAEIFATDIDFHRELRKGDTFSVVYEALSADDQPVVWNEGAGRVLAAEFVNAGKAVHAVWFNGGSAGRSGYFALDGSSKRRSFLASPLEFSRVTSGFANRFHPILQRWRQHPGVDYAAPSGTPVRSVGDGVVEFSGWQNGYGRVVEVRHGNDRSTLYGHLSAANVKRGDRVTQGQRIGAVGSTGWSTGPHLHFEFRVRGQHQDPLRLAKTVEPVTLDTGARQRFNQVAQTLQAKLELAESLSGTRIRAE